MKTVSRLYQGCIEAVSRPYCGCIAANLGEVTELVLALEKPEDGREDLHAAHAVWLQLPATLSRH